MRLVGRPRARKKWRTKSSRPTSPGAKNHPFGFGGVRPPPLSARPARSHLEELVEGDRHVGRIPRHHDVAPPLWAVLVPAVGLEGARARHLVDVQGDAQRLGELEARHHAGNLVEVQVPARPEAVHYLLDPRRAALRAGGDEDVVAPRGQGEPRQPPGLRLEAPEPLPERPDACGHRRVPAPLHGHRTEAKGGRRAGEDTPHPHTPPPPPSPPPAAPGRSRWLALFVWDPKPPWWQGVGLSIWEEQGPSPAFPRPGWGWGGARPAAWPPSPPRGRALRAAYAYEWRECLECFRRVKTGGEGRARGAEIGGKARSPGWNASRDTPDAVNSGPPPPRPALRAAYAFLSGENKFKSDRRLFIWIATMKTRL